MRHSQPHLSVNDLDLVAAETPRIDRPAVFYSPKLKPKRSPFASNHSGLDPMLEDEQEDEIGDPMSDVDISAEGPAAVTTNEVPTCLCPPHIVVWSPTCHRETQNAPEEVSYMLCELL